MGCAQEFEVHSHISHPLSSTWIVEPSAGSLPKIIRGADYYVLHSSIGQLAECDVTVSVL